VDNFDGISINKVNGEGGFVEAGSTGRNFGVLGIQVADISGEELEIISMIILGAVEESFLVLFLDEIHVLVVVDEGFSDIFKVLLFAEETLGREFNNGFRSCKGLFCVLNSSKRMSNFFENVQVNLSE